MITIELKDAEVSAVLARLAHSLTDMSPVMNEIGASLRDSTEDRFALGIAPDGSSWAPRSAATLANYKRRGLSYGPHPLHRSGEMSGNIHHSYGPDWAEVSSNAIQAAVMQFGAVQGQFGAAIGRTRSSEKRQRSQDYFVPIPWGDIPARPFLGISDTDRSNIAEIVAEWLERIAAGGGEGS